MLNAIEIEDQLVVNVKISKSRVGLRVKSVNVTLSTDDSFRFISNRCLYHAIIISKEE